MKFSICSLLLSTPDLHALGHNNTELAWTRTGVQVTCMNKVIAATPDDFKPLPGSCHKGRAGWAGRCSCALPAMGIDWEAGLECLHDDPEDKPRMGSW